jgi:hypothetical protein
MRFQFTPAELEILEHRPDDCINDCISENHADEAVPVTNTDELADKFDTIKQRVSELLSEAIPQVRCMLSANLIDSEELTPIHREIIANMVNNSTFGACADGARDNGDITQQKYNAICRTGDKLANKIQQLTGIPCDFPHR